MNHAPLRQALDRLRTGDWTAAHEIAQQHDSPLAAWLHGIVHLQEGDLGNAEYWYRKAARDFRSRGTLAEELRRFEAALAA